MGRMHRRADSTSACADHDSIPVGPSSSFAPSSSRTLAVSRPQSRRFANYPSNGAASPIEPLEPRRLLDAITPAGPEFPVNAHTPGSQQLPAIAMADDGDFIIVWCGAGPGDDSGIFAQRFDAAGQKRGDEFRVNTHTTGSQTAPAVAIDAAENFVITWSGAGIDDPDGIYARRFDAAGAALGDAFRVNTYTAGKQQAPAITFAANAGFIIAWESYAEDGKNYGIYAQQYDAACRARGSEFRVSQNTKGHQRNPTLAADAQGNFVVAWMGQSSVGKAYDIYARRFASNAQPQGNEFPVNTALASAQQNPAIAMNANGAFVIAWESDAQDDPDGKAGIFAQRYDPWGQKLGTEMPINTHTPDEQRNPAVAMADDGTFAAAWNSFAQDGSAEGIYAQYFDAAGEKLMGEFRANNHVEQSQSNPAIAMDARANFVIAWQSADQDGSGNGIAARRYLRNTQRSSIGDFVWNDADADGVQDAGETGVDGVTVRLLDQTGRLLNTTTTSGGGWYGFRDLPPGTYSLEFIAPAGFILTAAHRGNNDALDSDADPATGRTSAFVLEANHANLDLDAGLLAWPSITGMVFNDRSGNGKRDANEAGLPGWIVYLDANRNGRLDAGETSTITGPDGRYSLIGLSPGTYRVALSPQTLWTPTSPASLFYEVTLSMGQQASDIDFGNQTAVPNSTARAGSLLAVNTTPCPEFHTPNVAMNAIGDFAITWSGNRAEDGWRVSLQRYGSTVRKRGNETLTLAAPWNDLAMDAAGNFAIASSSASSIGLQWYNADGVLQRELTPINSTTCDDRDGPALAMDADGDLVIAWKGTSPTGTGSGIHLQRYNAAGVHQSNDLYLPGAAHPALAMDADGDFVLAWESQSLDKAGASHTDIRARRYSATGIPQGPEFRANTTLTGDQCSPAVAMNAAGDFVIAWDSNATSAAGGDDSGWGIYAQRYSAAGTPQGGEFRVNTSAAGDQRHPSAALCDDDLVIAWAGAGANGDGVYAQRYNAAGVAQGTELSVGSCAAGAQIPPDVAMDAQGNFIIAWLSDTGISARRFSVNHAPATRGIPNVLVNPNASDTAIDLFAAFADDKDPDNKLTYAVVNDSNPSLFTATRIDIATGQLILTYAPAVTGTADLTLRATDTGDLWVETTFTVTVGRTLQGTAADDYFHLRLDPSHTQLQVWHNAPTSAEPGYILPYNALRELTFNGQGGNDLLTVDLTNGNPIPSGGLIIDGSPLTLESTGAPGPNGFALHLRNNAAVQLASSLKLTALSIADAASLDLDDHDLILSASEQTRQQTLQQLTNWIKSARGSDGKWLGSGVGSSAANANKQTGLAFMLNDKNGKPLLTTFAGQSVTENDILVKYTWNGDVNLDGVIDAADYFLVDSGFITQQGGYRSGDVNLDGVVDAGDYFLVDSAFIAQTARLAAARRAGLSLPQGRAPFVSFNSEKHHHGFTVLRSIASPVTYGYC